MSDLIRIVLFILFLNFIVNPDKTIDYVGNILHHVIDVAKTF